MLCAPMQPRCSCGWQSFGSSFGNILKFGFELENMVCHIFFWPKAKRSKATHGKRPYQVIVQISPKYRGSFNTIAFGMAGLTWSTITTPAFT